MKGVDKTSSTLNVFKEIYAYAYLATDLDRRKTKNCQIIWLTWRDELEIEKEGDDMTQSCQTLYMQNIKVVAIVLDIVVLYLLNVVQVGNISANMGLLHL